MTKISWMMNGSPKRVLIACAGLALAFAATAQVVKADQAKLAPDDVVAQMMDENLKAMLPALKAMTQVSIDAQLEAGAKPATAQQLARFKRNLYQELLKSGFDEQQALAIVVATPLPVGAVGSK